MKIIKLLSHLRIKVREIDGHFLLIATLLIKYLKKKNMYSYLEIILYPVS